VSAAACGDEQAAKNSIRLALEPDTTLVVPIKPIKRTGLQPTAKAHFNESFEFGPFLAACPKAEPEE
jgi:hypothetical protein